MFLLLHIEPVEESAFASPEKGEHNLSVEEAVSAIQRSFRASAKKAREAELEDHEEMMLGRETRRLSDGEYYHVFALSSGEDLQNASFRVRVQNCSSLQRTEA